MSVWMFLKVFSDLCLLYAILGAFPEILVYHSPLLIPAVLCAFGAGLAAGLQYSGKDHLRWLGAAFPMAALCLSCFSGEFLIVLPAAVYVLLVILRGRLYLEYVDCSRNFRTGLRILGIWYVILCIFSFVEEMSFDDIRRIHQEVTLRYGLIYCFTGVILQRQLRLGTAVVARGTTLQMISVLVGTGSLIAGFLAAIPALRKGAAALIQGFLVALMSLIVPLFENFVMEDYAGTKKALQEAYENSEELRVPPPPPEVYQPPLQEPGKEPSYWWLILVVALAVIVGILLLRTFRGRKAHAGSEEAVRRIDTPQQNQRDIRRSNRGKVRHYYREYLRYEQKRGLRLKKYDTSGDILQKSSPDSDKAAAAELREIYLQARYDTHSEITQDQAYQAKALLKKIRSGKNPG